jgi:hypothetical protein
VEKELRMQKEEYEGLARQINQYPSRQDTEQELASVSEQLRLAKGEQASVNEQLLLKRKQFGLFFHSLGLLQDVLEGEQRDKEQKDKEEKADKAKGGAVPMQEEEDTKMQDA